MKIIPIVKSLSTSNDMKLQSPTLIDLSLIDNNEGQVEGLLPNPREIDKDIFEKLKKRIEEHPELLEYRALLLYPHAGRYITIGGNMRLRAMKELGYEKAPCFTLPKDTEPETLNAYQILDNVPFGKWDLSKLTAEWDTNMLQDFNINIPVPEKSLNLPSFFDEGDDELRTKIVIILPKRFQNLKDEIKDYIKEQLSINDYKGFKVR